MTREEYIQQESHQPAGPLSPAEWLEKQSIEVDESQYFSSPKEWLSIEDLLGRYAAHVAEYTHAAALQSAIDEINRTAFPGECLDRLFPVIESIKDIPKR